jgi:7-cyano-7-deazaguanine synthase
MYTHSVSARRPRLFRPGLPYSLSMASPAVILLSGGLDSAVTLAVARRDGFAAHALSFDYGQRHRHELQAAALLAARLGAATHRTITIDLRALGGSALTSDLPVPKDRDPSDASIPITYVPARNLTFLSIAAGYAETLGAADLYIGVNALDYSGYPDCRRAFLDAFERAANLGTRAGTEGPRRLRVRSPLVDLSKASIIRLGADLGVDFSLTTSCYDPGADGRACARCDACHLRRRGFEQAGIPDPTIYATAIPTESVRP